LPLLTYTGRAYAALDGDISPMHLYKATALLMGFPSPVANVHLLAARTEASLASRAGG
jgi:acyl dehydratase